jgi:cystathionine beta-lyase/cystathionine gamma-synthase
LTHASVPEASRSAIGITPELVRIAVGLEDVDDLMRDLEQALDA